MVGLDGNIVVTAPAQRLGFCDNIVTSTTLVLERVTAPAQRLGFCDQKLAGNPGEFMSPLQRLRRGLDSATATATCDPVVVFGALGNNV
jgi:hypothetical protein